MGTETKEKNTMDEVIALPQGKIQHIDFDHENYQQEKTNDEQTLDDFIGSPKEARPLQNSKKALEKMRNFEENNQQKKFRATVFLSDISWVNLLQFVDKPFVTLDEDETKRTLATEPTNMTEVPPWIRTDSYDNMMAYNKTSYKKQSPRREVSTTKKKLQYDRAGSHRITVGEVPHTISIDHTHRRRERAPEDLIQDLQAVKSLTTDEKTYLWMIAQEIAEYISQEKTTIQQQIQSLEEGKDREIKNYIASYTWIKKHLFPERRAENAIKKEILALKHKTIYLERHHSQLKKTQWKIKESHTSSQIIDK